MKPHERAESYVWEALDIFQLQIAPDFEIGLQLKTANRFVFLIPGHVRLKVVRRYCLRIHDSL